MKQPNRNALALLALMGFGFFVLVLWYGQQYLQTGVVRIEQLEKLEKIAAAAELAPTNPTAAAELVAAAEAPPPAIEPTEVVTGAAATIETASTEGEAAVEPSATATETVQSGTTMTGTNPLASPLAGTNWALVRLNGVELLPDTEITAEFLTDGTMTGTGSCNNFMATYATDDDQITFSTPESKLIGTTCEQAVEIQESAYLVALQAAARFETPLNQLLIANAQDTTIMEYEFAQVE